MKEEEGINLTFLAFQVFSSKLSENKTSQIYNIYQDGKVGKYSRFSLTKL